MYRVIRQFFDLQDDSYMYEVGDVFPRPDVKVSKKRIAELSGTKNKLGVPLIEEIAEKPKRGKKKNMED